MSCFSGQIVEKENSERRQRGKMGTPFSGVVSSRRSPPERYSRESFSHLLIRPAQYDHHRAHCVRYLILRNSSNGYLHIGLLRSRSNWCSIGDLPLGGRGLCLHISTGCRGCHVQALQRCIRLGLLRGRLTFDILYPWVVDTAKMTSTEYNSDGPTLNRPVGFAKDAISNDTKTPVLVITFVISRILVTQAHGTIFTILASANFTMLIYPASSRLLKLSGQ